eukprot:m.507355 g.507355  ORF g.507355 m.507355 type:complete len:52 (-) comp85488_c0_seq1:35-190(-)
MHTCSTAALLSSQSPFLCTHAHISLSLSLSIELSSCLCFLFSTVLLDPLLV